MLESFVWPLDYSKATDKEILRELKEYAFYNIDPPVDLADEVAIRMEALMKRIGELEGDDDLK